VPTRKQVKRQRKRRVHGGSERMPPQGPARAPRAERQGRAERRPTGSTARGRRDPKPASWVRALRRAPIFLVLLFAVTAYTDHKHGLVGNALQAALLAVFTIPLTYLMDGFVYRTFEKRKAAGR
jgi:hypothetical protein